MQIAEGEAVVYEEELLTNPYSLKLWLRYLQVRQTSNLAATINSFPSIPPLAWEYPARRASLSPPPVPLLLRMPSPRAFRPVTCLSAHCTQRLLPRGVGLRHPPVDFSSSHPHASPIPLPWCAALCAPGVRESSPTPITGQGVTCPLFPRCIGVVLSPTEPIILESVPLSSPHAHARLISVLANR